MGYSDAYLDLLDRALREGGVKRHRYTVEIDCLYSALRKCERENECRVNAAIRLINNPYGFYLDGLETDKMLLADFPLYTNSVERLAALSAFLDNENTPPEVRAKYEPERDRLKALPPEELVCATDVLNAQLDALLKAAERKKTIVRIRRVAVPVVAVLLCGIVVLCVIRKRVLARNRSSVEHV